ncbi:tyrosine-type recombinase/integrase [Dactylosporangium sp. NPDC000555]|uniref:tyrosine-type recombinase/integrase n=1 Tax=Dactylosporangium sp. NPDC000555 TaxID=3154260 RepID=UPI00332252B7
METTYDVRIYKTGVYKGERTTTYYVRWSVAGKRWKAPYKTAALAESFRSELVSAARRGEAFDVETGRPVSMARAQQEMSWYQFACAFVDMKWPRVAATTRRTHAEAMTAITASMYTTRRGMPDEKLLRSALCRWGFNTVRRTDPNMPPEVREALRWVERNTRPVASLAKPEVLRPLLDALAVRLDGQPAASSVVGRRRRILNTAVEYAIERQLLRSNPIPALKWKAPKAVQTVDRRSVANPVQVRTLLNAVREQQRSGPRLVAFFGCLYFAAMRPEEAVAVKTHNLSLPEKGWGEITLEKAEPHAGKEWTDTGENRDSRHLKQRVRGETRIVPSPPELTALLHWHIGEFGAASDGRLFVGERNGAELPKLTIVRAWKRAREEILTERIAATPLVKTPYDLRHAAVSTWLNGGVPATQVAEWAGHSVEVLLKIYAKCLDGSHVQLQRRIQAALGAVRDGWP